MMTRKSRMVELVGDRLDHLRSIVNDLDLKSCEFLECLQ